MLFNFHLMSLFGLNDCESKSLKLVYLYDTFRTEFPNEILKMMIGMHFYNKLPQLKLNQIENFCVMEFISNLSSIEINYLVRCYLK